MILEMVNQNVKDTLKKFQDNKNREFEKAQEQIKETIEALCEQQSDRKNTINREVNELRMKIDKIKGEVTQDMENLRRKEQNGNVKQNRRQLQQTRTSRRQNLRTPR
jgi:chromosome segregation ATPase